MVISIMDMIDKLFSFFKREVPTPTETIMPFCAVLKKRREYRVAIRILNKQRLPLHVDKPKNWDSLAALSIITRLCTDKSAKILDAGGEFYSAILQQLEACGYTNLTCINIDFKKRFTSPFLKRGNIRFEFGDITCTQYQASSFDYIVCLSVIEHGVNIHEYFKEMNRLLKIGGILFTSTDYWSIPIDTTGMKAYGVPIRIFDRQDILEMVKKAEEYGFELLGPLDFNCANKVVIWTEHKLKYTFIYFTLKKVTEKGETKRLRLYGPEN